MAPAPTGAVTARPSGEWMDATQATTDKLDTDVQGLSRKLADLSAKHTALHKDVAAKREAEITARKADDDSLRAQITELANRPVDNSVDEKIKTLASSLHSLKTVMAMKMMHEAKQREIMSKHLQKEINDLEFTVHNLKYGIDDSDPAGKYDDDGATEKNNASAKLPDNGGNPGYGGGNPRNSGENPTYSGGNPSYQYPISQPSDDFNPPKKNAVRNSSAGY